MSSNQNEFVRVTDQSSTTKVNSSSSLLSVSSSSSSSSSSPVEKTSAALVEKEMIGGCAVCGKEEGYEDNSLVYCDGCDIGVHQVCYGVLNIPQGDWYCSPCSNQIKIKKCKLCPATYGAFKATTVNGEWCHVACALWIPEAKFLKPKSFEPISLESLAKNRIGVTCIVCEMTGRIKVMNDGVCVSCDFPQCNATYHVSCAQYCGLLCEDIGNGKTVYKSYCIEHIEKIKLKRKIHIQVLPAYRPHDMKKSSVEDLLVLNEPFVDPIQQSPSLLSSSSLISPRPRQSNNSNLNHHHFNNAKQSSSSSHNNSLTKKSSSSSATMKNRASLLVGSETSNKIPSQKLNKTTNSIQLPYKRSFISNSTAPLSSSSSSSSESEDDDSVSASSSNSSSSDGSTSSDSDSSSSGPENTRHIRSAASSTGLAASKPPPSSVSKRRINSSKPYSRVESNSDDDDSDDSDEDSDDDDEILLEQKTRPRNSIISTTNINDKNLSTTTNKRMSTLTSPKISSPPPSFVNSLVNNNKDFSSSSSSFLKKDSPPLQKVKTGGGGLNMSSLNDTAIRKVQRVISETISIEDKSFTQMQKKKKPFTDDDTDDDDDKDEDGRSFSRGFQKKKSRIQSQPSQQQSQPTFPKSQPKKSSLTSPTLPPLTSKSIFSSSLSSKKPITTIPLARKEHSVERKNKTVNNSSPATTISSGNHQGFKSLSPKKKSKTSTSACSKKFQRLSESVDSTSSVKRPGRPRKSSSLSQSSKTLTEILKSPTGHDDEVMKSPIDTAMVIVSPPASINAAKNFSDSYEKMDSPTVINSCSPCCTAKSSCNCLTSTALPIHHHHVHIPHHNVVGQPPPLSALSQVDCCKTAKTLAINIDHHSNHHYHHQHEPTKFINGELNSGGNNLLMACSGSVELPPIEKTEPLLPFNSYMIPRLCPSVNVSSSLLKASSQAQEPRPPTPKSLEEYLDYQWVQTAHLLMAKQPNKQSSTLLQKLNYLQKEKEALDSELFLAWNKKMFYEQQLALVDEMVTMRRNNIIERHGDEALKDFYTKFVLNQAVKNSETNFNNDQVESQPTENFNIDSSTTNAVSTNSQNESSLIPVNNNGGNRSLRSSTEDCRMSTSSRRSSLNSTPALAVSGGSGSGTNSPMKPPTPIHQIGNMSSTSLMNGHHHHNASNENLSAAQNVTEYLKQIGGSSNVLGLSNASSSSPSPSLMQHSSAPSIQGSYLNSSKPASNVTMSPFFDEIAKNHSSSGSASSATTTMMMLANQFIPDFMPPNQSATTTSTTANYHQQPQQRLSSVNQSFQLRGVPSTANQLRQPTPPMAHYNNQQSSSLYGNGGHHHHHNSNTSSYYGKK